MKKRTWYLLEAAAVIIILVIAVTLVAPKFFASQQNINTPQRIPDPNFRAFIEEYMGVEPGKPILKKDAFLKKEVMDCSYREIQSLQGIEFFPNLMGIDCQGNELTELSLYQNKELGFIVCSMNNLNTLDISTLKKIHRVVCESNQITKFNFSDHPHLIIINISNNQIDNLTGITNLNQLEVLTIHNNNLTSDDILHLEFYRTQIRDFNFKKQNNGTFQVDPIEGVVGFLPSNP